MAFLISFAFGILLAVPFIMAANARRKLYEAKCKERFIAAWRVIRWNEKHGKALLDAGLLDEASTLATSMQQPLPPDLAREVEMADCLVTGREYAWPDSEE